MDNENSNIIETSTAHNIELPPTGSNIVITSENQMNQIMHSVPGGGPRYSDTQTTSLSQNHNGYINNNYDPPPPYDWSEYLQPQASQYLQQTEGNFNVQYNTYQPKDQNDSCIPKDLAIVGCGVCCVLMFGFISPYFF